jgi:pimeloyl-ACP methyl ester carboxylesterase
MSLTRPQRLLCVERSLGEMATSVELPQVKTWYDERGEGESLVLLHGGMVDARFFEPNIDALWRQGFGCSSVIASAPRPTSAASVPGLALYGGIKDSELAVVPGTSHFRAQEKRDLHNAIVVDFLASHHVAPMRRMPSGSAA